MRKGLVVLFACASFSVHAATVNKCVDADGKVTFTQGACSNDSAVQQITIKQSSSGLDMSSNIVEQPIKKTVKQQAKQEENGACLPYSSQEIRKMVIQKDIVVGMKATDVVKAWGKPFRINRSSHGSDQWVYDRTYVYIDRFGCVEAWN